MEFPGKRNDADTGSRKAKTFLTACKEDHVALFQDFQERAEEFPSLDDFVSDLEKAAWQLAEQVAKQSYRNGIARGRSGRASQ